MKTTIWIAMLALATAVSGCGSDAPSTPTPSGPPSKISQVEPATCPIGDTVTITGTGFTATGNAVRIGTGYLYNIPSDNTTTLKFAVRGVLGVCSPTALVCTQQVQVLAPGTYKLAVVNVNGTSNEVAFEVTAK